MGSEKPFHDDLIPNSKREAEDTPFLCFCGEYMFYLI